MNLSFLEELA